MATATGQRGKWAFGMPVRMFLIGIVLMVGCLAAGFLVFVNRLATEPVRPQQASDGIVVLTGGADRINDAMELLSDRLARRLLITGVNPATTRAQLRARVSRFAASFDCCVDLGFEARDTAGNAREAAAWAKRRGFKSIILVTSSYHMPRSELEMRYAAPHLHLQPFAVTARQIRISRWWGDPATFRLLASEYVKWIEAIVRTSGAPAGQSKVGD